MKPKIGIILCIILLVFVIISLTFFLISCLLGSNFSSLLWSYPITNHHIILEKTIDSANIKEIRLDQTFGDITINQSEDNRIHLLAYGNQEDDISYLLSQDRLSIETKSSKKYFLFGVPRNDIMLSLPASYSGKIVLNTDCGSCQIADFIDASFQIDCDAGNVRMGKVKNADVKCDCGNLEIQEITTYCNLKVDAGNINVSKLSLQKDSSMKVNMGNVTIQESSPIYIDARVDLGNANIQNSDRNSDVSLTIECDCGNITVKK